MSVFCWQLAYSLGFPGSSDSKESACNSGDPGLISGSGRSPGEELGYPLQYSWASLVAQMVKNQPAMQETWIQSMGWEDPLEESMANHSTVLAWRISMDREAWQAPVCGVTKSGTLLSTAQLSCCEEQILRLYVDVFCWWLIPQNHQADKDRDNILNNPNRPPQ